MTKLEQKLQELGYEQHALDFVTYEKYLFKDTIYIYITLDGYREKIKHKCIEIIDGVEKQQDIFNLQKAFNIMQKDLEVLKNEV